MGTVVLASPCSNSRDLDVTSPTSRILESVAPFAERLCGIGLTWLLLAAAVAGVVIVSGSLSALDRSPPPEHKVCPGCQKLLREHNVKLLHPELAGCYGSIHAAEPLTHQRGQEHEP